MRNSLVYGKNIYIPKETGLRKRGDFPERIVFHDDEHAGIIL
jgi:hypothetical protein